MKRRLLQAALVSCFWFMAMFGRAATVHADPNREYEVKAAFILNFIDFIEIDHTVSFSQLPSLTVCIYGQDPFAGAIEQIAALKFPTRTINVVHLSGDSDFEACHILYLSRDAAPDAEKLVGDLSKIPVLTVSDIKGFSERGGIIELVTESSKVRFHINLRNATQAGLRISSTLLRLATKVLDKDNP